MILYVEEKQSIASIYFIPYTTTSINSRIVTMI